MKIAIAGTGYVGLSNAMLLELVVIEGKTIATVSIGEAGELMQEQGLFLFGYGQADLAAAVSLTMPVRKAHYVQPALHPIFQMNLPEGYLLEQLQNRLAKIVNLDPMMLLALSGGLAPIGRLKVQSAWVNPLAGAAGKGERLSPHLPRRHWSPQT